MSFQVILVDLKLCLYGCVLDGVLDRFKAGTFLPGQEAISSLAGQQQVSMHFNVYFVLVF